MIFYDNNQPANPDLWNSFFFLTSLLGVKKFINIDTQNIIYSLLKIGMFIKQYFLDNKTAKNLFILVNIISVVWYLINAIYKSGWDRLSVDENNKMFHQCMTSHFIKNSPTVSKTPNANLLALPKSNNNKSTLPNCYGMLWTLTIFILFYFILFFLILYRFCFPFLFLLDDGESCDTEVTWCNVISLEHSGRVWKMMSEHMETT